MNPLKNILEHLRLSESASVEDRICYWTNFLRSRGYEVKDCVAAEEEDVDPENDDYYDPPDLRLIIPSPYLRSKDMVLVKSVEKAAKRKFVWMDSINNSGDRVLVGDVNFVSDEDAGYSKIHDYLRIAKKYQAFFDKIENFHSGKDGHYSALYINISPDEKIVITPGNEIKWQSGDDPKTSLNSFSYLLGITKTNLKVYLTPDQFEDVCRKYMELN